MSKSPADELIRVGNALIVENERLAKRVADQDAEIARLRQALGNAKGDFSFDVHRKQVLATTGDPPFRNSLFPEDDE